MNHESEEILAALLDGRLSAEEEAQLRSRLRNEAGLQELYEQLQVQRQLLQQLPRVKASDDFVSRVTAELLDRKVEVSLPPEEGDSVLRGSWQSAALLAASLAAVLLLGVFLWPRSVATDSPQVARFEHTEGIRKQEARERASLENAEMVETRPIQRAPSGPLPKPAESAETDHAEAARPTGGQIAGKSVPDTGRFANEAAPGKVASAAAAAPGGLAPAAGVEAAGSEPNPGLSMPALGAEANPELAGEGGRAAEPMAQRTRRAPPDSGNSQIIGALEERAALAGDVAGADSKELANPVAVEVWLLDAGAAADPSVDSPAQSAQGETSQVPSECELFLAEVAAGELPDWLAQLKAESRVTQLDESESGELLGQLTGGLQWQADNRPMSAAGIAGDELAKEMELRRSDAKPEAKGLEPGAQAAGEQQVAVNFLGLKPADKIEQLLARSQQRQQSGQDSAQALGGGGGEVEKLKRDANAARTAAEGYLSQLRTEADRQAKPAQQLGASGATGPTGKRIVIVVRGK